MKKVECKHNKDLVMTVLGDFAYGGVDYLILVDKSGTPGVFNAAAWKKHDDPDARGKAAEKVCQTVQAYYRLEVPWNNVEKAMKAWEACL